MGVVCLILLKKTKDGVYRAGQPVLGTVRYKVNKPTEFERITVSLIGKGKCSWSETDSDDNTTYNNNKEQYVSVSKPLLTSFKHHHREGTYECPFNFLLPENIPSSFKTKKCTIEYKIFVEFVKANFFNTSKKFDTAIPVYGCVNPCSPEPLVFGLKKELFSLSSCPTVTIKAEIERTFVTPGENIKLTVWVTNDGDVPITSIKTELMKYFTYISDRKSTSIEQGSVNKTAGYSPAIRKNTKTKYTCTVPTLPSLYSIQHTKILIGEYKVKLTARFPFPHKNASVEVPVVIGEGKYMHGAKLAYVMPSSSKLLEETAHSSYMKPFWSDR